MKRKKVVYIPISLIIISSVILILINSNPIYYKTLKYDEFTIVYKQYYYGKIKLWPGHFIDNEMLLRQANLELGSRLCKKYVLTKNPGIGKKIVSIAKEYGYAENDKMNIDSIVKYSYEIFNTIIYID